MRTVCWRLPAWDPDTASVRYRAAIPALHLIQHGVAARFSAAGYGVLEPAPPDAVVFVKAFADRDVGLAEEATRTGVPVVLDVCDNVFATGYGARSAENLRRMAETASAVVTTGSALAEVLRRELDADLPLHVVPDPLETPEDVQRATRSLWGHRLGEALRERRRDVPRTLAAAGQQGLVPALRRSVRRKKDDGRRQVLWFGNSGSVQPRFGIVNLVDIAGELEAAAREVPFRLLVVTDDREAYRRQIEPLALETAFEPWDRLTIFRQVRASDVVIVPNSRDEFSICKSANRPALALAQGVPVVATRIPSLDPLDGGVLFDDFRDGLTCYLTDRETAEPHVRRGAEVVEREFAPATVAGKWLAVFESLRR